MDSLVIEPSDIRPLGTQIRDRIREMIQRKDLRPGEKIPSMRALAQQTGVSLGIVKQALNGLTTEGYLRSHQGRGLYVTTHEQARRTLVLVLPTLDFDPILKIIRGVKRGLGGSSPKLLVQAADCDFEHEADLLRNLDSSSIAGAIIYPPPMSYFVKALRTLATRDVPHVLIDTAFAELNATSVTTDWFAMGLESMGYLLERGHRRIALVEQNADSTSFRELRGGMNEALRKVGLSYQQLPRFETDAADLNPQEPWANGQRATQRLLADHPDVTAIMGMNEHLSLGALRGAKASGRRVPEDVSVLSIGDLPAFATTDPPVTAFAQAAEEMGRLAGEILVRMLSGEGPAEQSVRLKPTLQERSSVSSAGSSAAV